MIHPKMLEKLTAIKVFSCGEQGDFTVSLPENRPGRLQLVFVQGDQQRVVEVPQKWGLALATSLLTVDGARADIKLNWLKKPDHPALVTSCPKCGATPTEACWNMVLKGKYARIDNPHKERIERARLLDTR